MYSQPLGGYNVINYPSPILLLDELLVREGEHIVLGDFNLHHPLWSGARNPTEHLAAEGFLQLLRSYDLSLALPQGSVT